jgi:quercetin dioxygenase-like cupin family protein
MRIIRHNPVCKSLVVFSLSAVLLIAAFSAGSIYAQEDEFERIRTVHLLQEPRHRTMHTDGDIRVVDVQINPGDTTLPHTHDFAIMYTFISNGEGPLNGRVSSITSYVTEPLTHRVSNEGPSLFRIIALGNFGPAVSGTGDRPEGVAAEPELENAWFRSYRVELAPGESSPLRSPQNPGIVVQVSEGIIHVSREDGISNELTAMGDWAWRDADSPFQLHNRGSVPVTLVINEARR